jgi:hypothetical protein
MGIKKNKIIYLSLLIICILFKSEDSMSNETKKQTEPHIGYTLLLDSTNRPTDELTQLLRTLNINHDETLSTIVPETQKQWLRQFGKERWQVEEVFHAHKEAIRDSAFKLGLINEIAPSQRTYKYAMILGASLTRTRTRLAYLVNLWRNGVKFDCIYCLGSERPLDQAIESEEKMLDPNNGEMQFKPHWQKPSKLPTTEFEMTEFVYEQSDLPEDFRAIPIQFINSPMRTTKNGTLTRPTTGDTIIDWLATKPEHGDCLFISNQPFVGYQDSVMRTYMPADFGFMETCGSAAQENPQNQNLIFLDTLARFLYQEKMRRDLLQKNLINR